jgi:hypothetical protein
MRRNNKLAALGMLAVLIAAGCTGPGKSAKTMPQLQQESAVSGKVVETMDGGGYTYVLVEKEGKKSWAAVPATKVTVGQQIKLLPGGEMTDFPSAALNRTFDKIIFSGGVDDGSRQKGGQSARKPAYQMSEKSLMAGKVAETMNVGTYTYLRIEKDGKNSWAAIPAVKLAVGDEVELLPGTEMGQFSSPSLKRSFDNIYFSSGLKKGPAQPAAAAGDKGKADTAPAALPAGHPKLDGAAAPAPQSAAPMKPIAGKVVETMNAGGYTYISLDKDGVKTWVAVPTMQTKVGEELSIAPGAVMSNFKSSSLNRSFEKIIFSTGPMR